MDVQILPQEALKLKIKKTAIVVSPNSSIPKTEADAVLSFETTTDTSKVANARLVVNGPGEYEVGGLKISSAKIGDALVYNFILDNLDIALLKSSSLSQASMERVGNHDVVILNADSQINQGTLTAMEPRAVLLYGKNSKDAASALGKTGMSSSKISISEDKLPEETEIYLLS